MPTESKLLVSYEEQVEDEGAAEEAKKEAAAVTEEESKQESSLSMLGEGEGAAAEVVALFLGNGCFLFSVSFGPARPVLWHCALHSSALRLFRAIAVPPCFAYKLAIVLPLLWLSPLQRCNIGAQIRVFLHSTTRISDGVQLRAHWTLSPASSKCPSDHSARVGGSGIPARATVSARASARASASPSSTPCCAALCRPVPCHTKIACT